MKISLTLLPTGYYIDNRCVRKDCDTINIRRYASYHVEDWDYIGYDAENFLKQMSASEDKCWVVVVCYRESTYDDGRSVCKDTIFKHVIYYPTQESANKACSIIAAESKKARNLV